MQNSRYFSLVCHTNARGLQTKGQERVYKLKKFNGRAFVVLVIEPIAFLTFSLPLLSALLKFLLRQDGRCKRIKTAVFESVKARPSFEVSRKYHFRSFLIVSLCCGQRTE